MTEIPEHLLKRAQAAREQAAAEAAGERKVPEHLLARSKPATLPAHLLERSKPTHENAGDPRIPAHLLERSKVARARASGVSSQPAAEPVSSSTPLPELPFEMNERPPINREQRSFSLAFLILLALGVGIGLSIGSFIWHANKDNDWGAAFEKSFFQLTSILIFALVLWHTTRDSSH